MLFRSDRKSTRLNSSHTIISYAVFCLKKKKRQKRCARHEEAAVGPRGATTGAVRAGHATCCAPSPFAGRVFHRSAVCSLFFFNRRGPPGIFPFSPPRPFPV